MWLCPGSAGPGCGQLAYRRRPPHAWCCCHVLRCSPGQQAVGHVPGELAADAADALVLGFKIGAVVDIAPAQRAGVEAVFICSRRRANHCAIQLGMFTHGDVIPAFAGKDAGLLHHRVVVAVHLVLAEVDAGGAAHRAEGEAAPGAGVLLSGVVAVAVLFGGEGEVATHVHHDFIPADLGAGEGGVAPAVEGEPVANITSPSNYGRQMDLLAFLLA